MATAGEVKTVEQYVVYLSEMLGEGSFGQVYKGKNILSQQFIAMKMMKIADARRSTLAFKEIQTQSLLAQTQHPNIVTMLHSYCVDNAFWIAMEYCDQGHLENFMENKPALHTQFNIMLQCALGLDYMHNKAHSKPVIHRDIKPTNILMKKEGGQIVAKIADFGISKVMSGIINTGGVGTMMFMAPELYPYPIAQYNETVDVFSLGLVYLSIAQYTEGQQRMMPHPVPIGMQMNTPRPETVVIVVEIKDSDPPVIKELKTIIEKMTLLNRMDRPSMDQVVADLSTLQDTYFRGETPPVGITSIEEVEKYKPHSLPSGLGDNSQDGESKRLHSTSATTLKKERIVTSPTSFLPKPLQPSKTKRRQSETSDEWLEFGNYKVNKRNQMGDGTFGKVFQGKDAVTGDKVVVKQFALTSDVRQSAFVEIKALEKLGQHPNILTLKHHKFHDDCLWVVMEYCTYSNISNFMKTTYTTLGDRIKLMRQCTAALTFMHGLENPVVHRNVKPSNILVTGKPDRIVAKLGDFTISKSFDVAMEGSIYMSSTIGTPMFMAPEIYLGLPYTASIDVFSSGLVYCAMLDFKEGDQELVPLPAPTEPQGSYGPLPPIGAMMAVCHKQGRDHPMTAVDEPDDTEQLKQLKAILRGMTRFEPKDRPTMAQVQQQFDALAQELHTSREPAEGKGLRDDASDTDADTFLRLGREDEMERKKSEFHLTLNPRPEPEPEAMAAEGGIIIPDDPPLEVAIDTDVRDVAIDTEQDLETLQRMKICEEIKYMKKKTAHMQVQKENLELQNILLRMEINDRNAEARKDDTC